MTRKIHGMDREARRYLYGDKVGFKLSPWERLGHNINAVMAWTGAVAVAAILVIAWSAL